MKKPFVTLEQVKEIALKEKIRLASVQALGAINRFTVGVFKTNEKTYLPSWHGRETIVWEN